MTHTHNLHERLRAWAERYGLPLEYLAQAASTNLSAREKDYPSGTIILAENQTAGRGQRGNQWASAPGENLTFSVVLHPDFLPAQRQFYLCKVVCLALVDTLEEALSEAREGTATYGKSKTSDSGRKTSENNNEASRDEKPNPQHASNTGSTNTGTLHAGISAEPTDTNTAAQSTLHTHTKPQSVQAHSTATPTHQSPAPQSQTQGRVQIKWPNDIYVNGRKIVGVLIENDLGAQHLARSIVGIGMNVNQRAFPAELPNPTSLALESGTTHDLAEVLANFYAHLGHRYDQLGQGNTQTIDRDYRARIYQLGCESRFIDTRSTEPFWGTISGVLPSGELEVSDSADAQKRYYLFKEIKYLL